MQHLIIVALMLMTVEPHPICQQTGGQQNSTAIQPTCYANLTANETFLNEWLSLHDESDGIDELRSRKDGSIASILLNLTTVIFS